MNPGSVLALRGDLGAGKTTFVQGLLEALGAEKPYVSPTFVIMKQYDLSESSANGIRRVYHVDAYRMDDPEEIEKLGFAEWCADQEGIVLVEWPEKIEPLLPPTVKTISFAWLSDTDREIVF
jgi:tRNA threonylcarbamoyladenosine biosynthesis protein TsaE